MVAFSPYNSFLFSSLNPTKLILCLFFDLCELFLGSLFPVLHTGWLVIFLCWMKGRAPETQMTHVPFQSSLVDFSLLYVLLVFEARLCPCRSPNLRSSCLSLPSCHCHRQISPSYPHLTLCILLHCRIHGSFYFDQNK